MEKIISIIKSFFIKRKSVETYQVLAPNNLMEAIKLNGFSIKRENDPTLKTIYFTLKNFKKVEEINETIKEGGIIVFSTNVKLSKNKLLNLIKDKIETVKNKKNDEIYAFIGKMVKGKYKSKDDSLYDENSFSVEILGVEIDVLNNVAKELAKEFKQETVLVKNYIDNKIYLINSD